MVTSHRANTSTVKYKIRLLTEGGGELDAAQDGGVWECSDPQEITRLITEKFNEGWVLVKKRGIGDWGWELFFRKRQ